jgi:chromosome segregation ATPase
MFNPELFLERMVNLAGNSSRFNATSTDELLKMALGHELKGLLLNYALAARQRAEITAAKEKEVLVDKNLATLEEDLKSTKVKLEGDIKTLKENSEAEVAKLVKAHDEELVKVKRNQESLTKELEFTRQSLIARDARIATLSKDHEAALSELATLKEEKKAWASEKEQMEETIGAQYDEGFIYALDQVKVLFPDIDRDRLGKADAMLKIDGDKLVSYAPIETTEEPPAKE